MSGWHRTRTSTARTAFTVLEVTAALGILSVAMVTVVQVAAWSLGERDRNTTRRDALEAAANVLEAARCLPWKDLTPEWAAAQRLPEELDERLGDGRLKVRVEPEPSRRLTTRVTVEIGWTTRERKPATPLRLVGLFSDRSAAGSGAKQ
jgi:hypothetical protein